MFVASQKHEHLKGLMGQGGPLRLQNVLALTEGAIVMVPNLSCSCHLVFLLMQASTCNSMASLMARTDVVRVMLLEPLQVKSGMESSCQLAV
jgi:hypothetical protein